MKMIRSNRHPAEWITALSLALLGMMLLLPTPAVADEFGLEEEPPPQELEVVADISCNISSADKPSDDGRAIVISWDIEPGTFVLPASLGASEEITLTIERKLASGGLFHRAGSAKYSDGRFEDVGLDPDESYFHRLVVEGDINHASTTTTAVSPVPNFFRMYRINALITALLMTFLVVGYIMAARKGADLYIRRIAGLDAIDEAVGRATEMGRKILYIPGIISINEPQTLASLGILGYVAKLTAKYGTDLEVPNADPLTMAAAREIVKQSYLEAGSPEGFHEGMVHYITQDQFAYAGAVSGIMVRDKPAATFLLGWFAAESLLLSETGQSINAIQIAGTAQVTQLPFFVAACDYTMLGEELFAASAYLSKDPLILGSIKGQDMMKAAILVMMVIGVIMATFGGDDFVNWFTAL